MQRWMLAWALPGAFGLAGCEDNGDAIGVVGTLRGPELVDYGDIPLGFQSTRVVELVNLGTGPITLVSSEIVAQDPGHRIELLTSVEDELLQPTVPLEVRVELRTVEADDEPRESTIRFTARVGADASRELEVRLRARGVDRGLFARPNPVDFGNVRIGSTVTRTVEVINLLSQPVDVFSAFSGTNAQLDDGDAFYAVTTPVDPRRNGSLLREGELLQPGERTLVEIEYRPQAVSVDEVNRGAWTLRSCEDSLCETTIELRGRGVRNLLACEPESVDFGTVQPARVAEAFVRCSNAANVDLDVEGWELADFSAIEFGVEDPVDFPRRLRPGDSFEIAVSFTGATQELGLLSQGSIDIFARTASDRAASNTEVPLRGTSGGPQIQVARAVDFGAVIAGRQGNASLAIANTGFADLVFERFEIVGADADAFSVVGDAPQRITQQDERVVPLRFTSDAAGGYEAVLVIETNDPLTPVVEVALGGVARDYGDCAYVLTPELVAFGIIPAQGQAERQVVFDNVGTETCIVRELRIENDTDEVFRLAEGPPSVEVAPGGRYIASVVFQPRAEEESRAELAMQVSRQQDRVDLEGSGGLGDLLATPTLVDFGNIRLGCEARSQTVNITNVGSTRAGISQFELRSAEAEGVFSLRRLPGGLPPNPGSTRPIDAGQTLTFVVDFVPERAGPAVADLLIRLSGRPETYAIPIRGEASDEPTRVDRYAQSDINRVDVLWVLDNSNSMNFVLGLVEQAAETIFDVLDDADIDYQAALVTTDTVGPPEAPCSPFESVPSDGWLRGSCGFFSDGDDIVQRADWKIIDELTRPSPVRAFKGLLDVPRGGSAIESGLDAARLALTPPRITGWNRDFLRADADLAVIIISNEDDQGIRSVPFYTQLVSALKGFGGRRATINAIVPPVVCIPGSEQQGRCIPIGSQRYAEAALRTGGIVENIGVDQDADPEEQAAQFADKLFNVVFSSTSLRALFPLTEVPAPGTLEVRIDGGPVDPVAPAGGVNWTYEPIGNRVRFTDRGRPPPGSEVEIEYQTFCF